MVEIIPKPAKKILPRQNLLFYLSLGLATAAVLGFFVLGNFESKALTTLQNLEDEVAQIGTIEERAIETKVFDYDKKINNFSILLENHQKSTNFFKFLEEISHPQVWFSNVILNLETFQAVISGQTPNFQTLGQQLLIFQDQDSIEEINLSSLSLSKEGRAEFTFQLSLDSQIFK